MYTMHARTVQRASCVAAAAGPIISVLRRVCKNEHGTQGTEAETARFMVFVSSWGCQRGAPRHPHCTSSFLMRLESCSRSLKNQSTWIFLPSTKLNCVWLQHISSSKSSSASGAGESGRPFAVDLGLDMSPSKSSGARDEAKVKDPQCMDIALLFGTDGLAENGITSTTGEMKEQLLSETLPGGGECNGGNIQGLPHWATARAGECSPPKLLTLVIIHKDGKVLLGMKKRGFGKGYYNGFGGKVEKGETIHDAAARELHEESGVTPLDMSKRGVLTFHFDNDSIAWEVHVFHVSEFVGDPHETEEMAPRWFTVSDIPYDTMWSDDILWYPELLKGRHFKGSFYFENTTTLVAHSLQVTSA